MQSQAMQHMHRAGTSSHKPTSHCHITAAQVLPGVRPARCMPSLSSTGHHRAFTSTQHGCSHSLRQSVISASASTVDATVVSTSARDGPQQPYAGQRAVVVGAGPAGSTAAMMLARQGFQVEVYERRPEPRNDPVDLGRAYIIILIPRGQAALAHLGIPLPTDDHFKSLGTVRHPAKGKVSVSKESNNVVFSRNDLAQFLVDEARKRYPDSITFHFNADTTDIDLANKKVTFSDRSSSAGSVTAKYDLLVGADGAGSKVRGAVAEATGASVEVSDSGREYKVYLGLRGDIEPPEFKGKIGATLHLYTTNDAYTTVTAHSNPDGTYSGTFSMRTGEHAQFKSQEAYEALLRDKFPGLPADWIPEIAKQAVTSPASPAGKRVKCSQLHAPGVLVLGDAAHAVTPVFGQGANSALESCKVLDEVLTACVDPATQKGNVGAVPAAFTATRREDAHALFWIDAAAYSFFAKKPTLDFFALAAHGLVGAVLSKVVPFLYGNKVALFTLGSAPYSTIYKAVKRDATGLLVVVLAALAFGLSKATGVL